MSPRPPGARPDDLDRLRAVEVDVREDIRRGVEPFARIMTAVKALGEGEALLLRVPFEPKPLYDVLGRRGFVRWTERHSADDWSVWFYVDAATAAPPAAAAAPGAALPLTIDVRGLEPPLPMVSVLERLEALGTEQTLEVIHDRRPMFLYAQLDERGFAHETDEPEPGMVRIRIRRRA